MRTSWWTFPIQSCWTEFFHFFFFLLRMILRNSLIYVGQEIRSCRRKCSKLCSTRSEKDSWTPAYPRLVNGGEWVSCLLLFLDVLPSCHPFLNSHGKSQRDLLPALLLYCWVVDGEGWPAPFIPHGLQIYCICVTGWGGAVAHWWMRELFSMWKMSVHQEARVVLSISSAEF